MPRSQESHSTVLALGTVMMNLYYQLEWIQNHHGNTHLGGFFQMKIQ